MNRTKPELNNRSSFTWMVVAVTPHSLLTLLSPENRENNENLGTSVLPLPSDE